MQFQKEEYWSECNGAADPGRTCESSSMCRAQSTHPSEAQHDCLVEYVVYVVSTLCFSILGGGRGGEGRQEGGSIATHSDA